MNNKLRICAEISCFELVVLIIFVFLIEEISLIFFFVSNQQQNAEKDHPDLECGVLAGVLHLDGNQANSDPANVWTACLHCIREIGHLNPFEFRHQHGMTVYDIVLNQYLKYNVIDGHPRSKDLHEFARNRLHINNQAILDQLRVDEASVMNGLF